MKFILFYFKQSTSSWIFRSLSIPDWRIACPFPNAPRWDPATNDWTELSRKSSFPKFRLDKENAHSVPFNRYIPWAQSGSTPFHSISQHSIYYFSFLNDFISQWGRYFSWCLKQWLTRTRCLPDAPGTVWVLPSFSVPFSFPGASKYPSSSCPEVREAKWIGGGQSYPPSLYPEWSLQFSFPSHQLLHTSIII